MDYYLARACERQATSVLPVGRAAALIYRTTRGVPRLVNIIAHKSLLLVYGEGGHNVLPRHVRAAAKDTPSARSARYAWWWSVVPTLAVAAVGAFVLLGMR
jgi:MSHA biogenesis protein MshM